MPVGFLALAPKLAPAHVHPHLRLAMLYSASPNARSRDTMQESVPYAGSRWSSTQPMAPERESRWQRFRRALSAVVIVPSILSHSQSMPFREK